MAAFCVPPPRPCYTLDQRMDLDGPLVLNALLVVVERYSALKRARFGSDTSAEALRGMCVLLCLAGVNEDWDKVVEEGVPGACDLDCGAQGEKAKVSAVSDRMKVDSRLRNAEVVYRQALAHKDRCLTQWLFASIDQCHVPLVLKPALLSTGSPLQCVNTPSS